MDINPPRKVRAAIYIVAVMGTAVLVPLDLVGILHDVVMPLWSSVSGAACLLAGLNVAKK